MPREGGGGWEGAALQPLVPAREDWMHIQYSTPVRAAGESVRRAIQGRDAAEGRPTLP